MPSFSGGGGGASSFLYRIILPLKNKQVYHSMPTVPNHSWTKNWKDRYVQNLFLGDFQKFIVNNVGHAKNLASAVYNSTSKELWRQLSLKYMSLLSLKLKQNKRKGKPSLINIDWFFKNVFFFIFPNYGLYVVKRISGNNATISKKSLPILISTVRFNRQQEPGPLLQ